ncbi:hypothetical protein RUND412_001972 [Rhizina undulata]
MNSPTLMSPIPITILTGFLGSGKTTLLLSLLPQLPRTYKLCLLKNEFGDVAVDSKLASEGAIAGVQELLNGCICCNLVGQLGDALLSLREYRPDRIVIETSGSAFPATLAMEVNRISQETNGGFALDGVVMVIDVENWQGYEDTSYTAKIQGRYTDLIIFNKWESVGERREDEVMDRVRDLGDTPVVKSDNGWISKDVVFGIDGGLAKHLTSTVLDEAVDVHGHNHSSEVDVLSITLPAHPTNSQKNYLDVTALGNLLNSAPRDEIYRIKGIFRSQRVPPSPPGAPFSGLETFQTFAKPTSRYILNWAFGRWTYVPVRESTVETHIEAAVYIHDPDTSSVCSSSPPSPTIGGDMSALLEIAIQNSSKPLPIEITVERSIRTVVEEMVKEEDAARLTVVLARGEGERWRKKILNSSWIKWEGCTDVEGLAVEKIV